MARRPPRVAGFGLRVLVRAVRTPVAGRSVTRLLLGRMLLDRLRAIPEDDMERRTVVHFRTAPRRVDDP